MITMWKHSHCSRTKLYQAIQVTNIYDNTRLSNLAGFLLELSSLVRGLRIYQEYAYGIPNGQNYLLGAENVHWAPIFIEMLTRKLDKLWIQNSQYCEYLSYHDVEILKEVGDQRSFWKQNIKEIAFAREEYMV